MWQRIRRIGFELYAFLTAPFVVRNCLLMLAFIAGFIFLTFWGLRCYTKHGQSLQVPNYVGMNFREASKKARSRDFHVAVSDSIFVPGKAPGEILSQSPDPQSRVKEGRTLYFTVAKNNPDIIKLPELAGRDDYDMYSRKLAVLGLNPRILARVADPVLSPNTIVAVLYRGDTITRKIRSGFQVEMGGTVDFIVSDKVTLNVSIPNCVCQTYDAARFLLQSSNLSIGAVIRDNTVTDENSAYVARQTPAYDPNGKIRVGEQVDLFLTQNPPVGCEER